LGTGILQEPYSLLQVGWTNGGSIGLLSLAVKDGLGGCGRVAALGQSMLAHLLFFVNQLVFKTKRVVVVTLTRLSRFADGHFDKASFTLVQTAQRQLLLFNFNWFIEGCFGSFHGFSLYNAISSLRFLYILISNAWQQARIIFNGSFSAQNEGLTFGYVLGKVNIQRKGEQNKKQAQTNRKNH
jgi:hypothetical protein